MLLVVVYVQIVYINNSLWESNLPDAETNPKYSFNIYSIFLIAGISYPLIYELIQAF
jgi:hypothetical protein